MYVMTLDFFVPKIFSSPFKEVYKVCKYLITSELRMDDKVIPLSSDPNEQGKTFTVSDLHPCNLNSSGEYRTVAVTLWDGNRERTSHTAMWELVSRRWH